MKKQKWWVPLLISVAAMQVEADDAATASGSPARVRAVVRLLPQPSETKAEPQEDSQPRPVSDAPTVLDATTEKGADEPARFSTPLTVSPQGELPETSELPTEPELHRAGEIATSEMTHVTSALSIKLTPLDVATESVGTRGFLLTIEHLGVGTAEDSRVIMRLPPGARLSRMEPSVGWSQDESDPSLWTHSLEGLEAGEQREWRGYLDVERAEGRIEARVESWAEVHDAVGSSQTGLRESAGETNPADSPATASIRLRCEGPAYAKVDATLIYTVRIINTSNETIERAEIVPKLDAGLYLEGRRSWLLAEPIPPGEEATLDVAVRAMQGGEQSMHFELRKEGRLLSEVEHRVQVEDLGISTRLEGTSSTEVGAEDAYEIHVEHLGDVAVDDLVVNLTLPPGLRVTRVEHEPGYDPDLRMMAWRIVRLEPGAHVVLGYRGVAQEAGEMIQYIDITRESTDAVVSTRLVTRVDEGKKEAPASPRAARAIGLRNPFPWELNRN